MWLHMLLSCGFFDTRSFPHMHLQEQLGLERRRQPLEELRETGEVKDFIERKMKELVKYDDGLEKVKGFNAVGKMQREEFVVSVRSLFGVDE